MKNCNPYADTAFHVVKYNFTYFPSLSIPDHLISAGVLSGIAILTKTGDNCVLSYGKLASHSDQARTDRYQQFCYWHENICGLSSRIGISSRVCSLTQVKKYQVRQKDFYMQFIRAGINKPQAIKTKEVFPTNYILGYEANLVQEWGDVIMCSCHTCSHH